MERDVCTIINKNALLHKRLMTKILERFNLTYAQYQVLKIIKAREGLSAKEVLSHTDTDKATLSGVLARLEKRGLIIRESDDNDRRLKHIRLVAESRALCETVADIESDCERDLLKGLKTKEIRIFFEVSNHIADKQLRMIDAATDDSDEVS